MTNKNNKVMKANAPKKIYLQEPTIVRTQKMYDNDVEYTRTDAFIEKALAFIRSCTTYDGLGYKAKCVNIEEFRNYMNGE